MIYLATNCDRKFYETKPKTIIESLLKYKSEDMEIMFFQIGFNEKIDGVIDVEVPLEEIVESKRFDVDNRPFYVCLESGEFTKFYNFNDDDILILLDYDIIQQRPFEDYDYGVLNNLKDGEFYLSRNGYGDNNHSYNEADIVCMNRDILGDRPPFRMYNCGCQVGKISTWKTMYEEWKKIYKEWEEKCKHHATGQLVFNYIGNEKNMIKELHPSFHSSWGFHLLKHFTRDKKFYLVEDEKLVLFNHHVWHPHFI